MISYKPKPLDLNFSQLSDEKIKNFIGCMDCSQIVEHFDVAYKDQFKARLNQLVDVYLKLEDYEDLFNFYLSLDNSELRSILSSVISPRLESVPLPFLCQLYAKHSENLRLNDLLEDINSLIENSSVESLPNLTQTIYSDAVSSLFSDFSEEKFLNFVSHMTPNQIIEFFDVAYSEAFEARLNQLVDVYLKLKDYEDLFDFYLTIDNQDLRNILDSIILKNLDSIPTSFLKYLLTINYQNTKINDIFNPINTLVQSHTA